MSVEPTLDIDVLSRWKGRRETRIDTISANWCRRMEHTLGRPATLVDGDPLPPLWHFITHLDSVPMSGLGRDGHPARGGFLPPVALPRRMWAGGRFTFHRPVFLGQTVTKHSSIADVVMKSGRSGPLCFVTVVHELEVDGQTHLREEQDLVYRQDPSPDEPAPAPNHQTLGKHHGP